MKSIAQRIAFPIGIVLGASAMSSCAGGGGSGAGSSGLPMTPAAPVENQPVASVENPGNLHARAPHVSIKEIAIPPTIPTLYTNFPVTPQGGIAVAPDSTVYVSLYMPAHYPYYYIPYIFVGAAYANGRWSPIANATDASASDGSGPATGAVATTRDGNAHLAGQHPYVGSDVFAEAGMTITGPIGLEFALLGFNGVVPDMAGDSKGNLWYALSPSPLNSQTFALIDKALHDDLSQVTTVQLSTDFRTSVEALAAAPNGDAWVATELANSSQGRKLYHISAAGTIVHTYAMPRGTSIGGVAVAPDNSVWLTDSADNIIWELSRFGTFLRHAIPTPASGVARITVGGDGALWFTERNADKIGRIATNGNIHEYAIPTPHGGPTGISSLGPGCSPNVIWFEEQAAGKIAEITII